MRNVFVRSVISALALLVCASATVVHAEPGDIIARLGPGSHPNWSDDGQLIAFRHGSAVHLARTDGLTKSTTAILDNVDGYTWAAGRSLVFGRSIDKANEAVSFYACEIEFSSKTSDTEPRLLDGSLRKITESERNDPVTSETTGPWKLPDGSVGYFELFGSRLGARRFVPFEGMESPDAKWKGMKTIITRVQGSSYSQLWGDLWLVPITSENATGHRLTEGERFGMVHMSPSGDRFITRSGNRDAWVIMDTLGTEVNSKWNEIQVFGDNIMSGAVRPVWSPDGSKLAYVHVIEYGDTSSEYSLFVDNIHDGTRTQILSSDHGRILAPAWSPSCDRIAVSTSGSGLLILEVQP